MDSYKIAEKMSKKGDLKLNQKRNFINIILFKDSIKELNGKGGKKFYLINLLTNENHQKLQNKLFFILPESNLSKFQPDDGNRISFWLFANSKITVQRNYFNATQKRWCYDTYGTFDAETIKRMTYSENYYKRKEFEKQNSKTNPVRFVSNSKIKTSKDFIKEGIKELNEKQNIEEEMG